MKTSVRCYWALAVLLTALANRSAGDEPLSRVEIARIGKAGTALVEIKGRGHGSAFCIHPSGLFITNEHVAQGDLTIILKPGTNEEKVYQAKVVRSDKELDLALLRIDGVKDLPTLSLGSDDKLAELMELVAIGFPFGTAVTPDRKGYPEVSINVGSVTALRRKNDALYRIQLDAALNPGNSGGPVLDKNGKVVGVVVSGIRASGVNHAIPVSILARFIARPDFHFEPPQLGPANIHQPVRFEAVVLPVLKPTTPITVELVLKAGNGKERRFPMEPAADGKYNARVVPLTPPSGGATVRLLAQFENSMLNATTADRTFKVGGREVKLSEVAKIQLQPAVRILLQDGKAVEGDVSGLEAVPVRLGEQLVPVNLFKAAGVRFGPAAETDQVSFTLVVRQGDNEILRQTESLAIEGLLPTPAAMLVKSEEKVYKVQRFEEHAGAVHGVAWSPDGKRLASASADKTVIIRDALTGQHPIILKKHRDTVWKIAFSPDGKRLASASQDGTAQVWDSMTGRPLLALEGHRGTVYNVVFCPDGKRLVTAGHDGTVKVWDATTGNEVLTLKGHIGLVIHVAFSPDGKHLASAGGDSTVRLWEAATGREIATFKGHSNWVQDVAFSPDGRFVASGARDRLVKVWDITKGEAILSLEGHTDGVQGVAFSPNGRYLASSSEDRTVKLWEAKTGQKVCSFTDTSAVYSVAFSPDGKMLASGGYGGIMRLWQLPDSPGPAKDKP